MKRAISYALLALLCISFLAPFPLYAREPARQALTAEEKDYLEEVFEERKVPKEKRQGLIEKLEAGEVWDSMKEEYKDMKPQVIKDHYTITWYPDGSFLVEGIIPDITHMNQVALSGMNSRDKRRTMVSGQLANIGVKEENRKSLVDKLERGEVLDSVKKEYKDLEAQEKKAGYRKTEYPDGSVAITYAQSPDQKKVLPWSPAASGKKVASAYQDRGFISMYFEVTYEQKDSSNRGRIDAVSNYNTRLVGGTDVEEIPGHINGWKNPTHAWYATKVTLHNGVANRRCWLKFFVNGRETWQKDNFYL